MLNIHSQLSCISPQKYSYWRVLITVTFLLLENYSLAFLEGLEMVHAANFPWIVFLLYFMKIWFFSLGNLNIAALLFDSCIAPGSAGGN